MAVLEASQCLSPCNLQRLGVAFSSKDGKDFPSILQSNSNFLALVLPSNVSSNIILLCQFSSETTSHLCEGWVTALSDVYFPVIFLQFHGETHYSFCLDRATIPTIRLNWMAHFQENHAGSLWLVWRNVVQRLTWRDTIWVATRQKINR